MSTRISWLEQPVKRLTIGVLAMLIYTIVITTIINYVFVIIVLQKEFSSEIIRDQFVPSSLIAVIITRIISLFLQYSSSRLKLKLMHSNSLDSIVSRDRVQDFKDWLDQ